ncbi:MAG: 4Fe-4S binding protein [Anaerolineales bacterium]|nr:4Fe-4S binding protein [Anaerolineales bacterium]
MTAATTVRPRARRRKISRTQLTRRLVQAGFLVFILLASLRHFFFEEASTASIDALCPFGGVETLWQWATTGEFVPKTHPSSLVLMVGLLLATIASGATFCGWICPFGTLQDGLTWLRTRLHIGEINVPGETGPLDALWSLCHPAADPVHDRQHGQTVVCRL